MSSGEPAAYMSEMCSVTICLVRYVFGKRLLISMRCSSSMTAMTSAQSSSFCVTEGSLYRPAYLVSYLSEKSFAAVGLRCLA